MQKFYLADSVFGLGCTATKGLQCAVTFTCNVSFQLMGTCFEIFSYSISVLNFELL